MKLEFTLQQLAIIDKALQQLPYYLAAPLIMEVNKQLEDQKQAMETPIKISEN